MLLHRLHALALAFMLAFAPVAEASQNSLSSPTTGTVSGLQLTNNFNNALDSLNTANSGGTAPTNQLSGTPSLGNLWLDTSVTPNRLKMYDGAQWVIVALVDTANHYWVPVTGGGTVQSIASASATDLCSSSFNYPTYVSITGSTTITGFSSNCQVGQIKFGIFASSPAPLLTYNATSLILPTGGNNYQASQNDTFAAVYLGSGNWRVLYIQPASGGAISPTANFIGAVYLNGVIAPAALAVSQNNWAPAGIASANVVRITTSASSSINITGITAPAINGQRLTLVNDNATGAAACSGGVNCSIVLTANDGNSSAANRFCFARPYGLDPQKSVTIVYGASGAGFTNSCWRIEQAFSAPPIGGLFKNAKLVNGGTPNNQLTYTADELVVEDINNQAIKLAAINCTADITVSGAGGLDTGSVAQGTGYYFWIIFNPSTNAQSCMFSTQSALGSISFPLGYTHAARVGWDYVENAVGKRLNRILCYGRKCHYTPVSGSATASIPTIVNSTSIAYWTAESVATFVPATASRIVVNVNVAYSNSGSANGGDVAPDNVYPATLAGGLCSFRYSNTSGSGTSVTNCDMELESTNIYVGATGSPGGFAVYAYGWEDNL